MGHAVTVRRSPARPTLVVAATTTWQEFPQVWGRLSGEVWDCLRAAGVTSGCPNVMLYRDDVPHVEVGVLLVPDDRSVPLTGQVTVSALPAGTVASTVHRGPFAELGAAHEAVLAWCDAQGARPSRTRWEVYGPHRDDPAQQQVEVSWLLLDDGS